MYKPVSNLYFEISGGCNGSCPYCVTGKNRILPHEQHSAKWQFLTPERCYETMVTLQDKGLITPSVTTVQLYNWGEPFLNPQCIEVFQTLADLGYSFGISTNASVFRDIPAHLLKNVTQIIFSMSGMTQKSYGRNHGFDVERIKSNIRHYLEDWKSKGHVPPRALSFHVYQYNWLEIFAAHAFCRELGLAFTPGYANLGHFELAKQFLTETLSPSLTDKVMSELFTFYIPGQVRPNDFRCPQFDVLSLDQDGNVTLCCGTDASVPGFVIGRATNLTREDILNRHQRSESCKLCQKIGIDYVGHSRPPITF